MKVKDVEIDDDYVVVHNADSILDVAKKIAEAGIPDAVVLDADDKVVGSLDDYDIISKVIAPEMDLKSTTAADIMFVPPPVRLSTELEKVHEMMEKLEATALPVIDDDNKLLGVITIMDILEAEAFENRSICDKILGR